MEPSTLYYIHNSSVQPELLFREDENYSFFMKCFFNSISRVATIHKLCLLPDQFHALIEVHDIYALKRIRNMDPPKKERGAERFVVQQFSNLFNSYAQAYNKRYFRQGALFRKNFKYHEVLNDYKELMSDYVSRQSFYQGFSDRKENWDYIYS